MEHEHAYHEIDGDPYICPVDGCWFNLEAELARAEKEAETQIELYGYVGVWTAGRIIDLRVTLGREA